MKRHFKITKQLLFTVITGLFSFSAFTGPSGKETCHEIFSESESEELAVSYQEIINHIKSCEVNTKQKFFDLIVSPDWPDFFSKSPHKDYKEWNWGDLGITDEEEQKKPDDRSTDSLTAFLNKTSEYPADSDDYFEVPNREDELSKLNTH